METFETYDLRQLDPSGGVLATITHWRPRVKDPDPDHPGEKATAPGTTGILCFDRDLKEPAGQWEALATNIITVLHSSGIDGTYHMASTGQWSHGLLTGHASPGMARYIGRKTRLRTRQRELEALESQQAQLEEEFQWFTSRLFAYEQQLEQLQEKLAHLRKVLPQSGLEEVYLELVQTQKTLNTARDRYQKARQHTQEARQSYNAIIAHLERESQGVALLISDHTRVQATLISVIELKNQANSLHTQFQSLVHSWEEYQQASVTREQAQANEANSTQLYEHVRQQALQVRAEMEEFQRVASLANAEELSERLRMLRERDEILAGELNDARQKHTRADERYQNIAENLVEIQAHLQEAQEERAQRQARFLDLLTAYPVETLLAAHQADLAHTSQTGPEPRRYSAPLPGGRFADRYHLIHCRCLQPRQRVLSGWDSRPDDRGRGSAYFVPDTAAAMGVEQCPGRHHGHLYH